jgi:hypothetical protein
VYRRYISQTFAKHPNRTATRQTVHFISHLSISTMILFFAVPATQEKQKTNQNFIKSIKKEKKR